MDLANKDMIHGSQAFPPVRSPGDPIIGVSRSHSSETSFPIIAIAIIGILATTFCCNGKSRIRPGRHKVNTHISIQEKSTSRDFGERSVCECAVCLNEFQEDEKLRIIPNCSHIFHIDCIDVWLQNNANCPLCRTSISSTTRLPIDRLIAPSSTPQDPNPYNENVISGDEGFVVIELGNQQSADQTMLETQERLHTGELSGRSINPPRKLEQRIAHKMTGKLHRVTSMGDECIDIRDKDDQFAIQPIRRSFSMDSSADPKLYLAIQEAVRQKRQVSEASSIEGCSSRVRRSFFPFGHSRGSRSAVLPVHLGP